MNELAAESTFAGWTGSYFRWRIVAMRGVVVRALRSSALQGIELGDLRF
jgi:hypothetical protein